MKKWQLHHYIYPYCKNKKAPTPSKKLTHVMHIPQLTAQNVTAIVLNYNGYNDTISCLQALLAMPDKPSKIIVIDNNSTDTSLHHLQIFFPTACVLKAPYPSTTNTADASHIQSTSTPHNVSLFFMPLQENNGYSAGNNAGITRALEDPACEAVWIINNDTTPLPNSLDALCQRLNLLPDTGIVGSTLVFAHSPQKIQCTGGFSFNKALGTTRAIYGESNLSQVPQYNTQKVEKLLNYISGASMLVPREVFEKIGLFAKEYFLYYEDTEFGIRAQKAGIALAWAPNSVVLHKEGASTKAHSLPKTNQSTKPAWIDYVSLRNRVYLLKTHYPCFLPFVVASYVLVALRRIQRGQAKRIPLIYKALWDGLCNNMGKPQAEMEKIRQDEKS